MILAMKKNSINQMTHGNKSTYFPLCINDPHAPMLIAKKLKMI
jgi:hypothetical protein